MHKTPVVSSDTRHLPLVHSLDEELQILERSRRENSVPEVEDVARPATCATQDLAGALTHEIRWAKQHRRIQVALDAAIVTYPLPANVQGHAPVERHDVWSSRGYRLEQAGGVRAEVDAWHAG